VVGCVAEVLDLGVADFGFWVYEEDLAGDLVVLFPRRISMVEWGLVGWLVSYDQRESNRGSDCACSDDCHAGGRGGGHFRWLDFLFSGWIWFDLASWEYESLYRLSLQTLAEVVVIQYVARSEV
jgi:hypothetical protein